ncbi:MAG: immunoglobulin-like domain-containing protein [Pseudomonadota bacterium]
MKKLISAPVLLCSLSLSALAASALHPITDIGTLGGEHSYPQATNARGDVVGYAYTPGNSSHHAFLWTASGGIQDLGSLGGSYSNATGINERGDVVGYASRSDGSQAAFFWSAATGMIDLGSLSSYNNYSYVQDINDSGAVTGYAYTDSGYYHAFKWTQATGMVDLGTLGGTYSYATKINNAGQVAGYSYLNNSSNYYYYNTYHTFFHSDASGMVDVGTLGASNSNCNNYYYYCYDYSYPQDMNEAGEIVGYSYNGSQQFAFYWSQARGLVDMGNQGNYAYAYDINDAGQAVGQAYSNGNSTQTGFVWTYANGLQAVATLPGDSNSYLYRINQAGQAMGQSYGNTQRSVFWSAATGTREIPPLAGASYIYAQAINDLGQVVGQAQTSSNNAYHAFVWTAADGTEDLGTLNDSINSYAFLVSNSGQAAGVSHIEAGGYGPQHAVVWDAGSRDTTPPVISLLGDAIVGLEACASYSDAGATALDDKDGNLTAAITVSGGVTANTPGSYTLRYNVSDAAGNAAVEVSRTVQVADTTPPVIGNVSIDPSSLWPANHKMVNATLNYTATDSCAATVNCAIAVTSNEPINGTGDGDTAPDWSVSSDHYLQLRAERAGSGNGRVYSVALRCVDTSGNSSSAVKQVVVPKSQKK